MAGRGLIHKARGRTSNRSHNEGIRKYAVELVKTRYADFGPTLATEVLLDKHQLRIGKETLRRWMMAEGLWLSRTQRRTFHQPRLRRESYGELIQIDGSDHRWFEQRGEPCTLLVFIDDATSKLMQLRFVPSESTDSYFEALQRLSHDARLPCCLLLRQAHRLPSEPAGCEGRFGHDAVRPSARRAQHRDPVRELKPGKRPRGAGEPHAAGSSGQGAAHGRASATWTPATSFLPEFMEQFNEKFSVPAAKTENMHRRLNVQASRLADILCHREQRHVSQQLSLAYDRRQIILERSEVADKLAGQYVEVYDFSDRPLEVRWKGHLLPYRVFSKDQRVSHTAIVENKRLSHALAIVKAQQDIKRMNQRSRPTATRADTRRTRVRVYGPDYKPKIAAAPAVEMTA